MLSPFASALLPAKLFGRFLALKGSGIDLQMGASILVHWSGATEDEEGGHPGFFNDDHPWASWIVAVLEDTSIVRLLHRLGVGALLSVTSNGVEPGDIDWTTPDELERAANKLRELVQDDEPLVEVLVDLYEEEAAGEESPSVELARDLSDVAQIAGYARGLGAQKITLGYYW